MPRATRQWTSAEAAERLHCSVQDLLREARLGGCGRKEGGRWTFGAADLRVYRRRQGWTPPRAPRRASSSRLTRGDLAALAGLDRLLAQEREVERRYDLPFRAPQQVATTIHGCGRCGRDLLFLIFADEAKDAAGLLAYGRLLAEPIRRANLPAYALAPLQLVRPVEEGTSLLMRVWPEPDEARVITPPAFDQLLAELSAAHCGGDEAVGAP
jgi:hypothetical protein